MRHPVEDPVGKDRRYRTFAARSGTGTIMDNLAVAHAENVTTIGAHEGLAIHHPQHRRRQTHGLLCDRFLLFLGGHRRLLCSLTDPRNGCEKTYHIRIDENLSLEMEEQIQRGLLIELEGVRHKTRPSSIKKIGPRFYEISITEGKNRQVRRMIEAVGREVISLHRISVAGLRLDVELPGAWRDLTQLELASLRAQIQERKPQSRASDRFKHR
jgi:pseudouridine synthase